MTEKANNIRVTKNAEDVFTALRIFFELINMAVPKVDNQLTDAEIQLLCLFMSLPQDKFRHQRFGKLAKKKVLELASNNNWELSVINLNNKIYSMVTKGFLVRDEDGIITISNKIENAVKKLLTDKEITFTYEVHLKESTD